MSDLQKLFRPLPEFEATTTVKIKETRYTNYTDIYIPNTPFQKLLSGLEVREMTKPKPSSGIEPAESDIERSIRRTKKKIADYMLCNDFDLFATFTFDKLKVKDRNDISDLKKRMSLWLKNQQKRIGKFKYLIVSEFHKDGAIHFHAVLAGYKGVLVDSGVRAHGHGVFNIKGYRLGFTNVQKIYDTDKTLYYLRKYITKDMPLISGKHRYWASHDLARPVVVYNPEPWYTDVVPVWELETEHGRVARYLSRQPSAPARLSLTDGAKLSSSGAVAN